MSKLIMSSEPIKKSYLLYHKDLDDKAYHDRYATDQNVSTDVRDGMVFTARQVFDIIQCLKDGEIPNTEEYSFGEITLWQGCRDILLSNKEYIELIK